MHQDDSIKPHTWDGKERRGVDGITLRIMTEFRKIMDKHEGEEKAVFAEIKTMIREKDRASQARYEELGERFDAMQQSTSALLFENNRTTAEIHKLFKAAFPEGDAESHRRAHETWIAKAKAEQEFWTKLKGDAVRWAVIAALGWAGVALWAAFLKGPGG